MVINYDRRQGASVEEKMDSLVENIMLAMNELQTEIKELKKEIKVLKESQ